MAQPIIKCQLCKVVMNVEGYPSTHDCGGDCTLCMAEAGDPRAIDKIIKEFRTRRDQSALNAWSHGQRKMNGQ